MLSPHPRPQRTDSHQFLSLFSKRFSCCGILQVSYLPTGHYFCKPKCMVERRLHAASACGASPVFTHGRRVRGLP